jgi:hypothetical protein
MDNPSPSKSFIRRMALGALFSQIFKIGSHGQGGVIQTGTLRAIQMFSCPALQKIGVVDRKSNFTGKRKSEANENESGRNQSRRRERVSEMRSSHRLVTVKKRQAISG